MSDQREGKVNPTISEVFHKLRNTYQALYSYHGTPEGEEKPFTSARIMEFLEKDIELMAKAENACKNCCKDIKL